MVWGCISAHCIMDNLYICEGTNNSAVCKTEKKEDLGWTLEQGVLKLCLTAPPSREICHAQDQYQFNCLFFTWFSSTVRLLFVTFQVYIREWAGLFTAGSPFSVTAFVELLVLSLKLLRKGGGCMLLAHKKWLTLSDTLLGLTCCFLGVGSSKQDQRSLFWLLWSFGLTDQSITYQ